LHALGQIDGFTYPGWNAEDGDPNFVLTFARPISAISVLFSGDFTTAAGIANFDGNVIGAVRRVGAGAETTVKTATLSGLNTTRVLVVPGSYGDWASVTSITFTPVPEPTTVALVGLAGLAGAAGRLRRRSTSEG
jgi:hypothetical protein